MHSLLSSEGRSANASPYPAIKVRPLHNGVRYSLPPMPFAIARLFGLVPVCIGGTFVAIGGAVAWSALQGLIAAPAPGSGSPGGGGPGGVFGVIFGGVFVIAGLVPFILGLHVLLGEVRIELRRGALVRSHRIGPLAMRKTVTCEGVTGLRIRAGNVTGEGGGVAITPTGIGALTNLAMLELRRGDAAESLLMLPYPRPWMEWLAHDLAARLDLQRPSGAMSRGGPVAVEVKEVEHTTVERERAATPVQQPVKSNVVAERERDHLTLTIPPAGLRKGSAGLFFFSLFWLGFMTLFTGVSLFGLTQTSPGMGFQLIWWSAVILFWGIGVAMLLGAINMGRRSAIIDVLEDTLLVNRASLFGVKQHQWARDEIDRIVVGPSGMEVNNRPVLQLQVHPREGKKIGMFSGRDETELRWIAWELHAALRLNEV